MQQVPVLIRTFVKLHAHHRITDFEGQIPVADELQVYKWYATRFSPVIVIGHNSARTRLLTQRHRMDATLREVLLTLRSISSPKHTDLQHPLAQYTFRAFTRTRWQAAVAGSKPRNSGPSSRDLSNASVLSESFNPVSQPGDGDTMDTDEERARREREDRTLE
jgi:Sin3 associated polypeptide p18 (SAP18)